jgi:hypothetical protein
MEDRRNPEGDRRATLSRNHVGFPLVDRNGEYVVEDRRTVADRRLNNISVEEVDCDMYITTILRGVED